MKALVEGRDNVKGNVNIKDDNGDYPIHIAAKLANNEALWYLLKSERIEKDAVDKVGVYINFSCCIGCFIVSLTHSYQHAATYTILMFSFS